MRHSRIGLTLVLFVFFAALAGCGENDVTENFYSLAQEDQTVGSVIVQGSSWTIKFDKWEKDVPLKGIICGSMQVLPSEVMSAEFTTYRMWDDGNYAMTSAGLFTEGGEVKLTGMVSSDNGEVVIITKSSSRFNLDFSQFRFEGEPIYYEANDGEILYGRVQNARGEWFHDSEISGVLGSDNKAELSISAGSNKFPTSQGSYLDPKDIGEVKFVDELGVEYAGSVHQNQYGDAAIFFGGLPMEGRRGEVSVKTKESEFVRLDVYSETFSAGEGEYDAWTMHGDDDEVLSIAYCALWIAKMDIRNVSPTAIEVQWRTEKTPAEAMAEVHISCPNFYDSFESSESPVVIDGLTQGDSCYISVYVTVSDGDVEIWNDYMEGFLIQ